MRLIGFYNYSVILTYLGLGSAITGIVLALERQPQLSVLCLLICGLCDMFDGTIARTCKRSEDAKRFGVQIDSLCDLVCFGVFPAMIGWAIGPESWFTVACMIVYVLAAVIRLAYFNVQEINREREDGGKRTYYEGLPVTSSALIMPIVIMAGVIAHVKWTYIYPITLLLMGAAFVSRIRVKKPYMVGLTVLAIVGLVVFVIVIRYGGNIVCTRSFTALA